MSRPLKWRAPTDASGTEDEGRGRGGGVGASEASNIFQSPGLSPIVDMRPCVNPCRSKGDDSGSMGRRYVGGCGGVRGGSEDSREDAEARPSSQRRHGRRGLNPGLSPITSEKGDASASSDGRGRPSVRRNSTQTPFDSEAPRAQVDSTRRPLAGDSPCPESSLDASVRSSLYMASTTLESMAPLDGTTQSFASYLRGGSSFAGELFADERLRESCTVRPSRYDRSVHSRTPHAEPGKWLMAPPPPRAPQEAPPRPSQASPPTGSGERGASVARVAEEVARASSIGIGNIPPAIVGAWLAAAIEGFYGHGAGADAAKDGDPRLVAGVDGPREASPLFQGPLDLDPALARSPLTDLRRRRANPAALLKEAREIGIEDKDAQFEYASAVGKAAQRPYGEDSPPPPPPPSPPLDPSTPDDPPGQKLIGASAAEMLYRRQRLLRMVASAAAASHGGAPQFSASGCAPRLDIPLEELVGPRGPDSRRHSDPLSLRPPASAAPSDGVGGDTGAPGGSATSGCATRGTPSYLRRHTSEYWRDRLGMTL